MEARARAIGKILEERARFCVPVYQRHYEWDRKEQWVPLWEDVKEKASEVLSGTSHKFAHYMGALIIAEGKAKHGRVPVKQVIDGQQRLTTFQVFLNALHRVAEAKGFEKTAALVESYITNDKPHLMDEPDVEVYKIWPTAYDREMYADICKLSFTELRAKYRKYYYQNGNLIFGQAPKLLHCLHYFYDQISMFVQAGEVGETEQERASAILEAIADQFSIVVISLDEGDDAQTIFSTLNARGKPLSAMDLIRNDIFHRATASGENAENLFVARWKEFEDPFWDQEERQGRSVRKRIEYFLGNALSAETGEEVGLSQLYPEYRAFVAGREFQSVDDEISRLLSYVPSYRGLVNPQDDDPIDVVARHLSTWDITTAFPLVMSVEREIAGDDVERAIIYRTLQSYVVRRAFCGLSFKNYNRIFLSAVRHLRDNGFTSNAFNVYLLSLKGESSRFPTDEEFHEGVLNTPIYRAGWERRTAAVLWELELARRAPYDDPVTVSGPVTVEHVLPSQWAPNWPLPGGLTVSTQQVYSAALSGAGPEVLSAIQLREQLKNTLGNLTLVTQPLNSHLGNGSFEAKKERLKHSALVLNRDIVTSPTWDENAIRERGALLSESARLVWSRPTIEDETDVTDAAEARGS